MVMKEQLITKRKIPYQKPGKRTARKLLKIKKELQETLDVVILDMNPAHKDV